MSTYISVPWKYFLSVICSITQMRISCNATKYKTQRSGTNQNVQIMCTKRMWNVPHRSGAKDWQFHNWVRFEVSRWDTTDAPFAYMHRSTLFKILYLFFCLGPDGRHKTDEKIGSSVFWRPFGPGRARSVPQTLGLELSPWNSGENSQIKPFLYFHDGRFQKSILVFP